MLLACVCLISALSSAEDKIGDNFEKGGFKLEGVAKFYYSENIYEREIDAGIFFFFAKGNALGINVNSALHRETFPGEYTIEGSENSIQEESSSIGISYDYTFGYNAQAVKGRAFSVGVLNKITSEPAEPVYYREFGEEVATRNIQYYISPYVSFNYYLAPRINVFVKYSNPINVDVGKYFTFDIDGVDTSLVAGIGYSFARKDIRWNKK